MHLNTFFLLLHSKDTTTLVFAHPSKLLCINSAKGKTRWWPLLIMEGLKLNNETYQAITSKVITGICYNNDQSSCWLLVHPANFLPGNKNAKTTIFIRFFLIMRYVLKENAQLWKVDTRQEGTLLQNTVVELFTLLSPLHLPVPSIMTDFLKLSSFNDHNLTCQEGCCLYQQSLTLSQTAICISASNVPSGLSTFPEIFTRWTVL